MPPMRKVRPSGASFAGTCVGLKKNTRFFSNAVSTSETTMPSAATPTPIAASFICLDITLANQQKKYFEKKEKKSHDVRAPEIERVVAHASPLSRMMQRTRTRLTAMLYIQKASAMTSIATSICDCMLAPRLTLTEAP